ncbi:MAG: hypothetical protein CL917_13055 [Deltaproteobacteria bacterium]|nr:hypothetical protein [Deltaproteobacteria bacterium]
MQSSTRIMLLDDGELTEVARLLDRMGVSYLRFSENPLDGPQLPPMDLLISTTHYAEQVHRGTPAGARPGRPLRIIATEEAATFSTEQLQKWGFHLRVQLPGHLDLWELLICRGIYSGTEKRQEERVAMGAGVSLALDGNPRGRTSARLMDISNRGCRILTPDRMGLGREIGVVLPSQVSGGLSLRLDGKIVRVAKNPEANSHYAGIMWNPEMSDFIRVRLSSLLNEWSFDPPAIDHELISETMPVLPSESIEALEGLTLDDETDPPIPVPQSITGQKEAGDRCLSEDRRAGSRRAYSAPVPAHRRGRGKVMMARDLSCLGMKIEPMPGVDLGQQIELVLHGPGLIEALRVSAHVARDDGTEGLVLAFEAMTPDQVRRLNQLVDGLPQLESLASDRYRGTLLAELVDEEPALR